MINSFQLIILIIIFLIFIYMYIDRICRCVENTNNPLKTVMAFSDFIKNTENENGNKSV